MEKTTKDRELTGVRKRQQIEGANKRIFLWVAAASVLVSFSIVALQLIGREFLFNLKIIDAKQEASATLTENLEEAKKLQTNIDALISDSNLSAVKRDGDGVSNFTVVLDALPTRGDATGFADSLQKAVFPKSGVAITELSTNREQLTADEDSTDSSKPLELPFTAGFGGSVDQVRSALQDMSRVIRPIQPLEMAVRADDNTLQVSVDGITYYLPVRTVEVETRTLKP